MSEDRSGTDDDPGEEAAEGSPPADGSGSTDAGAAGTDEAGTAPERESPSGEPTGPSGTGSGQGAPGGAGAEGSEGGTGPGAQAVTAPPAAGEPAGDAVPEDVRTYDRFKKVDRASYDRVNEFLRDRTYITAREWAIARLCADFRTATGVEMTKIGEHLPELVPFMTDTYTPQAVNQARSAFERKVRTAGATFLYGAMSGFFTADELDDLMYEVTEVAKFLLEVEGVELSVDEELDAEDRISAVMREVRQASEELRYDEVACPHCGEAYRPEADGD